MLFDRFKDLIDQANVQLDALQEEYKRQVAASRSPKQTLRQELINLSQKKAKTNLVPALNDIKAKHRDALFKEVDQLLDLDLAESKDLMAQVDDLLDQDLKIKVSQKVHKAKRELKQLEKKPQLSAKSPVKPVTVKRKKQVANIQQAVIWSEILNPPLAKRSKRF